MQSPVPPTTPTRASSCAGVTTLLGATLLAFTTLPLPATAQQYPEKPVTLVVPFAVGSQVDLLVRTLAENFSKALNQPFIVLNRDGAGGILAVASVAQSKPDGYTLGYGTQGPFTIQPQLRRDLRYKIDEFDFICQTNSGSLIVAVGPKSPFKSLRDLIEAARKAPGTLTFASVGIGTGPHLIAEAIALEAKVKFLHVPFRSVPDMTAQFMNGTVDFIVTTPILLTTNREVRALAVAGSPRLKSHPDVPLLAELDFKRSAIPAYLGLFAPKGMPAAALASLRRVCPAVANTDAFRKVSDSIASPVEYADAPQYTQNVLQDQRQMAELINALSIKAE
ncbi:MAG: Bug family tripartite tricarboxylate transporter substrate binding protein [Burkholderiales bacterium]